MSEVILDIRGLQTFFFTDEGVVKAANEVNLKLPRGKTLGLVGESGCGKTVTALSILRLVPSPPGKIVDGKILFNGEDLLGKNDEEMRRIRGGKISMIFQDPMTSLNPVFTIGDQVAEAIKLHQSVADKRDLEKNCSFLRSENVEFVESNKHDKSQYKEYYEGRCLSVRVGNGCADNG